MENITENERQEAQFPSQALPCSVVCRGVESKVSKRGVGKGVWEINKQEREKKRGLSHITLRRGKRAPLLADPASWFALSGRGALCEWVPSFPSLSPAFPPWHNVLLPTFLSSLSLQRLSFLFFFSAMIHGILGNGGFFSLKDRQQWLHSRVLV